MELTLFIEALKSIGTSLYALIAYVVIALIWGINLWRNYRLRTISERLKDLPEKDRLKALELEYKLVPKGGLDSESYLKFSMRNNYFIVAVVTIAAVTAIAALALYKSLEEKRISSNVDSINTALEITRIAKSSAHSNNLMMAAGNLESVIKLHPTSRAYSNLGYVYEEISNTEAALLAYKKALELDPNNPEILIPIGYLNKDLGRFEVAKKTLKDAIKLTTEGEENWFVATANLGNVLYEIGRKSNDTEIRKRNCEEALKKYFERAEMYQSKVKDRNLAAKLFSNMANCYKDIGDFSAAENKLIDAIAIKRKITASRSLADTLNNMADLHLKANEFEKAKPYLIEALSIFKVIGNDLGIGVSYFNLGDIDWAAGNIGEAKNMYQRSVDAFSIAGLGGEYRQAPRRRLERMANNDLPKFVSDAWKTQGIEFK